MGRPARRHPSQAQQLQLALSAELSHLSSKKCLRTLAPAVPDCVDFSSNDYLGLSQHPLVIRKTVEAVKKWGAGSGASRLLSGNKAIHQELESALARFKKEESALVFSSGYMASLGAVTALVDERDVILTDRLNHASLIDAARLSRAKLWVYPHLNMDRLEECLKKASGYRRRLVMTDAYFSMDGHVAPLERLFYLCQKTQSLLMIDEAHSTGVFGQEGRGLTEHFGLSGKIPVVMGTLSKALGSSGGYVAGHQVLIQALINRAKSFIYTTAPVPAASAAALASLQVLSAHRSNDLREQLWERVREMREGLSEMGADLMGSEGPIIPIRVGKSERTLRIRDRLLRKKFVTAAIRPPTVPKGTDRIRLSVSAKHTQKDIQRFLSAFKRVWESAR